MRRKLLCISAAMVFGIWCAGISFVLAVGLVLAVFLFGKVMEQNPQSDYRKSCGAENAQLTGGGQDEGNAQFPRTDHMGIAGLVLACAVAMLAGAVRMQLQTIYYDCGDLDASKVRTITAEVIKVSHKRDKSPKFTVRLIGGGKGLSGLIGGGKGLAGRKCLVTWSGGEEKENLWKLTGAVIRFRGKLEKPDPAGNPRCFDYRMYLRSQGIGLVSSAQSIKVVSDKPIKDKPNKVVSNDSGQGVKAINDFRSIKPSKLGLLKRRILGFRERFISIVCGPADGSDNVSDRPEADSADGSGKVSDRPEADSADGSDNVSDGPEASSADSNNRTEALLRGVLFGDTDSMDEDMKEDFRRNGTAHILAVSGLHIGLLYAIFRALRKKIALPGMTGVFVLLLGIYGTMTLWSVSVTRATAVILMMEGGERLDRRFDLLTSLGFVSMLVLMHDPYALYGTSFIMSYLAAGSIGIIVPALEQYLPEGLSGSFKTSLAVQIGLLPYIAYTFNMVPVGALIINIPVVMLLSVIVTLSVGAVPLCLVPCLTVPVRFLINGVSGIMLLINEKFADIDFLSPDVVSPPLFLIAAYYGVLFMFCSESCRIAWIRKDLRLVMPQIVAIVTTVFITCALSVSPFDKADVIMVDVGQGDCMHFGFRNHTDVLIDGGGSENYNIGEKTLKPYLLKNGVGKVDLAMATHLHTDHYKGLQELAEGKIVRKIVTTGETGDVISLESYDRIEIIWPDVRDPDTDDENKNSLIFKVYINGITVLITGDLGEEGEHYLVERYRGTSVLDCDVLKVCHHGSKYSSSAEFLKAVSPKVALIGVGKNNMYGHPSDEALERLETAGARVFRTDSDGAIGVWKKGEDLVVCKMK